VLAVQAKRGWMRPLPRKEQDRIVAKYIEELGVRPADPERLIKNLSGGNQQKVLLGRWLATNPEILILDEPTRGIDIGAKADIQETVLRLAEDGVAVLFISSELDEDRKSTPLNSSHVKTSYADFCSIKKKRP